MVCHLGSIFWFGFPSIYNCKQATFFQIRLTVKAHKKYSKNSLEVVLKLHSIVGFRVMGSMQFLYRCSGERRCEGETGKWPQARLENTSKIKTWHSLSCSCVLLPPVITLKDYSRLYVFVLL